MIQNDKTYMVLNYSGSPVSITTRNGSIMFESGSSEAPWGQPLTFDEIMTANMNGCAFKCGLLWFEPSIEDEMYATLKINKNSLLKDWEIEDIIMHPSADGYAKLLAIDHPMYFDRVRGVMMGLKSVFADIPNQSKVLVDARYAELREGKRRTEIKITKIDRPADDYISEIESKDKEIEELRAQLEALKSKTSASAETPEKKKSTSRYAKEDSKAAQ